MKKARRQNALVKRLWSELSSRALTKVFLLTPLPTPPNPRVFQKVSRNGSHFSSPLPSPSSACQGLTQTSCSLLHNSSLDLINIFYQRAVKDEAQRWGGESRRAEKAAREGGGERQSVTFHGRKTDASIRALKSLATLGLANISLFLIPSPPTPKSISATLFPRSEPLGGSWFSSACYQAAADTRMTARSLERCLFQID